MLKSTSNTFCKVEIFFLFDLKSLLRTLPSKILRTLENNNDMLKYQATPYMWESL